ncbi:unnamed protein product [Mesocestoides corti]|uniref:Uncharacterized protein n=1 Tax=Mesocestoides corti TaxID=53468 RepID=A0A3P6GG49_MESCO|nr:unnamed protein product [Mesocestoides corti]
MLRAFKRLGEILQQARRACHHLGYEALETLMRDAHVAINRQQCAAQMPQHTTGGMRQGSVASDPAAQSRCPWHRRLPLRHDA